MLEDDWDNSEEYYLVSRIPIVLNTDRSMMTWFESDLSHKAAMCWDDLWQSCCWECRSKECWRVYKFLMGWLMIIIICRERNKHLLTSLSLDYLLCCVVKVINFHLVAFTWGSKVRGVWVAILGDQKTRVRIADIARLFLGLRHCYDLETHTTYAQWWDIFVIMVIIWTSKGRSTINNDAVSETMKIFKQDCWTL